MLFAIPSKGRAGKVRSLKHLPGAVLFVPEYEAENYRTTYPGVKVVAVPAEVSGITKTRNWILDWTEEDSVVMVDDDVKACGWVRMNDENTSQLEIDPGQWFLECEKLFAITRGMGYRIFGIATQNAPRSVYPYKPFLWRSYVTASFMGICNESGIRFDERFPVKEDYELNLRCVVEDGGVVAARYIHWTNSHWHDEGGCKDYRSQKMEQAAIDLLKQTYPLMVRRVTRGGSDYSIELVF